MTETQEAQLREILKIEGCDGSELEEAVKDFRRKPDRLEWFLAHWKLVTEPKQ